MDPNTSHRTPDLSGPVDSRGVSTHAVVDADSSIGRPPTSFANRRAWTEPSARLWWLCAIAIFLIVIGYAVVQMLERGREDALIHHGTPVNAVVVRSVLHSISGQTVDAKENVDVRFTWQGKEVVANGYLTANTVVGQTILLHVDPMDGTVWTDRKEVGPLFDSLFVPLIMLTAVPLLLAIAWLRKRSRLKVWTTGEVMTAVVAGRGQSPLAPLSHLVRCSLPGSADKKIFTVYLPRTAARPEKGDTIQVVVPPRGGSPAAVDWFTQRDN